MRITMGDGTTLVANGWVPGESPRGMKHDTLILQPGTGSGVIGLAPEDLPELVGKALPDDDNSISIRFTDPRSVRVVIQALEEIEKALLDREERER